MHHLTSIYVHVTINVLLWGLRLDGQGRRARLIPYFGYIIFYPHVV